MLGLLWSYVKPLMQFMIYFVALGIFLNLQQAARPNYAIYLFSGIVLVNFFTETLGNATRSIVDNRDLIRKIYLPRELFPVSTVWVSAAHFLPQVADPGRGLPHCGMGALAPSAARRHRWPSSWWPSWPRALACCSGPSTSTSATRKTSWT